MSTDNDNTQKNQFQTLSSTNSSQKSLEEIADELGQIMVEDGKRNAQQEVDRLKREGLWIELEEEKTQNG